MITYLSVSNLSVIKKISVDFDEGLNIITGETGAGKSVLIGAISLLIGERFNKTMLRNHEHPVKVEAVINGNFTSLSEDFKEEFEIDDELILKRIIDAKGKNKIFINGNLSTVKHLKDLAYLWIDIHGQHEHQKLLDPKNHLSYLDSQIQDNNLEKYNNLFEKYQNKLNLHKKIENEINNTLKEKKLYEFQIKEIEELNIIPDEDINLDEKIKYLSNIEKITSNVSDSLNKIKNDEVNIVSTLSEVLKNLSQIEKYSETMEKTNERLTSVYYEITDCADILENFLISQENDPSELNTLIGRKFKIDNLIQKYGNSLEDVIEYKNNLKEKLDNLFLEEEKFQKMKNELNKIKNELEKLAQKINQNRKSFSKTLCKDIEKSLAEVDLKDTVFEIKFNDLPELDENCGIQAEFFISTNKGFKPAPLSLVASGGEVSRVMLALKEIFHTSDKGKTLVFDEIDTGISGQTANKVSSKLKKLSETNQLIVITHLPVVASKADKHFHIIKQSDDTSTETIIKSLNKDESVNFIAKMISGEITESSISSALELIGNK